jgi:acyl-coenzyme A synthetase/AMP-(fatty) acid ligase
LSGVSSNTSQTYWQTETGSHVITPLAGVTPTKPGSASLPFFGIEPAIIDPVSGEELHGNDVEGVLAFKQAWPSMARTVWGAHKRYMDTYLNVYKGYYFTGDGAARDHEGYYWIRGRVDDVVNVSGHRLSTAEIEAALIEHNAVAEAAVVGVADELTGQAVAAFVAIKTGNETNDALRKDLVMQVRKSIGPFAAPKAIHVVPDLPKTRSGKIMRRILRKILAGEEDQLGDITTVSSQNTNSTSRTNTDLFHSSRTLQSSKRSSRLCTPARSNCIATDFDTQLCDHFLFGYHFFSFSLSSKLMSTDVVRAVINRRCRTTIYSLLTIPNI